MQHGLCNSNYGLKALGRKKIKELQHYTTHLSLPTVYKIHATHQRIQIYAIKVRSCSTTVQLWGMMFNS